MGLLDLFKKEKYTYRCNLLNRHLHFTSRDTLDPCCSINVGPAFIENLSKNESILSYIKNKQKYIQMFKNGDIPSGCINCPNLEKYSNKDKKNIPVDNDTKINYITLNHYVSCDCACIYCAQGNMTIDTIKENYNRKIYDVKNFLKELYKNNLIDKENLQVSFQGGNISCLKDHNEILNIFVENGVNLLSIYTNNIVYLPLVEKLLVEGKAEIATSLDCASRDLYKKIKQVDKFEQCIENLKKYISVAPKMSIIVKYIIIEDINDNIEEITKFVELMQHIGVERIAFDIDFRLLISNIETRLPTHYKDLIQSIHSLCKNKEITYSIHKHAEDSVNRGYTVINR